jgi:hypothetical protein
MLVSVCMLLLESAAFALDDGDATRRTIQTQTELIRHRSTEHRQHTAGHKTAANQEARANKKTHQNRVYDELSLDN